MFVNLYSILLLVSPSICIRGGAAKLPRSLPSIVVGSAHAIVCNRFSFFPLFRRFLDRVFVTAAFASGRYFTTMINIFSMRLLITHVALNTDGIHILIARLR